MMTGSRLARTSVALAAFMLAASPALAADSAAAKLSVTKSVRAGAPQTSDDGKLAGAGPGMLLAGAAVAAGLVVLIVSRGGSDDTPVSP